MRTAVVLSSHTIGLGAIRALGVMGVPIVSVYYNKSDMGFVSKYVKESVFAPHPEKEEKDFLEILFSLAEKYPDSLLLPCDDATLFHVSKYKDALSGRYTVACPDFSTVVNFVDKKHTYALAESNGIAAPKTLVLQSDHDVEKCCKDYTFPCLVKPCYGHRYQEIFKCKMTRVDNIKQLIEAYRAAAEYGLEVMLQEFIPGDDTHGVNYNSYFWDGKPVVEFTAEKVRLSPPNFGVPRVVVSKKIPEIIEPGRKILQALGFNGYSCTEFKRDKRTGEYILMEVNGRINLSCLHAYKCGINFPWIIYNHLMNDNLQKVDDFRENIYWIDMTKDIISSISYSRKENYTWRQLLHPYQQEKVFAILNAKDMKPFVKRVKDITAMALNAAFDKIKRRDIDHTA